MTDKREIRGYVWMNQNLRAMFANMLGPRQFVLKLRSCFFIFFSSLVSTYSQIQKRSPKKHFYRALTRPRCPRPRATRKWRVLTTRNFTLTIEGKKNGAEQRNMATPNNPRKFSEKIALHNQKQAEETAAFEEVMKDLSITRAARVTRPPLFVLLFFFPSPPPPPTPPPPPPASSFYLLFIYFLISSSSSFVSCELSDVHAAERTHAGKQ